MGKNGPKIKPDLNISQLNEPLENAAIEKNIKTQLPTIVPKIPNILYTNLFINKYMILSL